MLIVAVVSFIFKFLESVLLFCRLKQIKEIKGFDGLQWHIFLSNFVKGGPLARNLKGGQSIMILQACFLSLTKKCRLAVRFILILYVHLLSFSIPNFIFIATKVY
jgi:hypothetical protein